MKLLNQSFSFRVKTRLLERGDSVAALARRLRFDRASCSLVIHQRRRMPRVEAAIRKELGL